MIFQSFHFLLFLGAMVLACGLLWRNFSARKNLLLAASFYFYMCWDWRFGALLAATVLLHYHVALRLAAEERPLARKAWLALSIAGALGALAYFKYANFFIKSAAALAQALGGSANTELFSVVLPIGISFYTFQALSYVIDVYRRQQAPTHDLRDFALFVSFFPTVLAGPITRSGVLLPQIQRQQTVPGNEVEQAAALVARGFIKKAVFADPLAVAFVDPAFANPEAYGSLFLLLAVYAFSFQIYMDVSGYTDIARGSALLCGFRLPQNFDRPYLASSVSNFWQRWHISMSSFFRDYVFRSLGGSRSGSVYLNLMITFLAIGLWHGGGWNFLLYGGLHGTVVCIERALRKRRESRGLPPLLARAGWTFVLRVVLVFHFVALTRILFRAADLEAAGRYLVAMASFSAGYTPITGLGLTVLALAAVVHWGFRAERLHALDRFRRLPVAVQACGLAAVAYLTMAISASPEPFVYFKF